MTVHEDLLSSLVISGELTKYGLFPFSLWVLVILMEALGIIWGLVFIGFAIFNICGKPIETITGPLGLYLWKGLACKCTINLIDHLYFPSKNTIAAFVALVSYKTQLCL